MVYQRQPAKKARIEEIVSGEWVEADKTQEFASGFVKTASGEDIFIARVMGIVVSKFVTEDSSFGSITIDDGSETIRAKCWKDLKQITGVEVGQLVDLVAKVRFYNQEIYLVPDILKQVKDPNAELLRRLELLALGKPVKAAATEKKTDAQKLRADILKLIEAEADGISYSDLVAKSGISEDKAEQVIDELLSGGLCYEPAPGVIKKI